MAKKAEQNKLVNDKGITLEKQTYYDDSLLPSADELEKLNEVSRDILPWIMKRTEMEQDARIRFNDERIKLTQRDMKHTHAYNFIALVMAFIIVIVGFLFSFFLVKEGYSIAGTIFGGGVLTLIVSYFLKSKRSN